MTMYVYICVCWLVLLFALVAPQAPGDRSASCPMGSDSVTRVLLDSNHYETLLPDPWSTLNMDGDAVTWAILNTDACMQTVGICNLNNSQAQQDFLITQHVDASMTPQARLLVDFSAGTCPISETCTSSSDFNILIYRTSSMDQPGSMDIANYVSLESVVMSGVAIDIPMTNMGFYLAFGNSPTCAEITRVQVLYTVCPGEVHMFAQYMEVAIGGSGNGSCVDNAVISDGSTLNATCTDNSGFDFSSAGGCQCSSGFGAVNDTCEECAPGHYFSDGSCMACPTGSDSAGGSASVCTCDDGYATADGSTTTTTADCDHCQANFLRSGDDGDQCVMCPEGSSRAFDSFNERMCVCDNNLATMENSPNTTTLDCIGCIADFYDSAQNSGPPTCIQCPSNSMSNSYDDITCRCNVGTELLDNGGTTTTDEPCSSCAPNFYRSDGTCVSCPDNSQRTASTDDDSICVCLENYRRRNDDVAQPCLPIVGFTARMSVFTESSVEGVFLRLSAPSPDVINVPIQIMAQGSVDNVNINNSVEIPANTNMSMVRIMFVDNDLSLERSTTFDLVIASESPNFVVGGNLISGTLYERITVEIEDDDLVQVGFTEDRLTFNESASDASFTVMRIQPIATNLELTLSGVDQPIQIDFLQVTLTPESDTVTVPFEIIMDSVGGQEDRVITLQLEYNGRQFEFVEIGGGDTHSQLEITIHDDDAAPEPTEFPLEAIIGIACGAAGLAVLILIIVILCLCICRLRVNRQGFYHTYEDKTSEPPTMLRYSASLRSISSQTVMPVTEGRSVPKENEFYV